MRGTVSRCAAALLLALGVATTAQGQRARDDSLRIVFFDVGQGDAAMIVTPEGKHILVDAGPDGARITSLLEPYALTTLDLVVASHNHADHIGGMADIFAKYQVKEYLENGVPALTKTYRRTVDAVTKEKGLTVREATSRRFRAGSASLTILAPVGADESQNNNSVGLALEFGTFSAVFSGDAEGRELDNWLGVWSLTHVSVLKASHHGSTNGVTPGWMAALTPRVVVVSVGAGNTYGHPAKDVLLGWQSQGARVYRTDAVGTITVSAARDGGFSVTTSSGAMPWVSR